MDTTFTYNDRGRTVSKQKTVGQTTYAATYGYMYGDKLKSVASDFPGDASEVAYNYDGLGKRRNKLVNDTDVTWWRWDAGWGMIAEYAGQAGSWTVGDRQMSYTLDGMLALADVPGANPSTGTYRYYAQDHLAVRYPRRGMDEYRRSTFGLLGGSIPPQGDGRVSLVNVSSAWPFRTPAGGWTSIAGQRSDRLTARYPRRGLNNNSPGLDRLRSYPGYSSRADLPCKGCSNAGNDNRRGVNLFLINPYRVATFDSLHRSRGVTHLPGAPRHEVCKRSRILFSATLAPHLRPLRAERRTGARDTAGAVSRETTRMARNH